MTWLYLPNKNAYPTLVSVFSKLLKTGLQIQIIQLHSTYILCTVLYVGFQF